MMLSIARFFQLVLGGIVVGTMFAVWAGYDSRGFSYTTYVEQHQNAVLGLNTLIPALAMFMTLITLYILYLQWSWAGQRWLLLAAVICFVVAGLATRFGCQPINAIVDTWTLDAPPSDWEVLRAEWWRYHFVRMAAGTVGYFLIVFAVVRPQQ